MGKDLRSNKRNKLVIERIQDQHAFDELFSFLFHHERPLVMRTADAIEKITKAHPEFLSIHKEQIFRLLQSADHIELKWHIAQLLPRLQLTSEELEHAWKTLSYWVQNPNEGKIVRINALQSLYDLSLLHPALRPSFLNVFTRLEHERAPSLQARMKKLKVIKKIA